MPNGFTKYLHHDFPPIASHLLLRSDVSVSGTAVVYAALVTLAADKLKLELLVEEGNTSLEPPETFPASLTDDVMLTQPDEVSQPYNSNRRQGGMWLCGNVNLVNRTHRHDVGTMR